jgi:hypothetical protein
VHHGVSPGEGLHQSRLVPGIPDIQAVPLHLAVGGRELLPAELMRPAPPWWRAPVRSPGWSAPPQRFTAAGTCRPADWGFSTTLMQRSCFFWNFSYRSGASSSEHLRVSRCMTPSGSASSSTAGSHRTRTGGLFRRRRIRSSLKYLISMLSSLKGA